MFRRQKTERTPCDPAMGIRKPPVLRCAEPGVLALYQKVLIGFPQTIDKLEFYEFSTHAVILSAARSAKSKNLRNYQLHSTNQV